MDLSEEETDRLENYVIGMGIRSYRKWQEEWILPYRGQRPEEVPEIEKIRKKLMMVLGDFTDRMKVRKERVLTRLHALYDFIVVCNVQEKLKASESYFETQGMADLAQVLTVLKTGDKIKVEFNNVVWFGSYGITADGHSKFYNENDIHDNFADKQQGVCDSLTQRLSVIRGELWYNINFGLPLLEKIESKIAIDAAISEIVLAHPDVEEIATFESGALIVLTSGATAASNWNSPSSSRSGAFA